MSAGTSPQTPLGSLQCSPSLQSWLTVVASPPGGDGMEGGTKRSGIGEREWRKGKRRGKRKTGKGEEGVKMKG